MDYEDDEPYPTFTSRHREDGWTREKQVAFLQALEAGGVVSYAARAVGMCRQSVYRLRRRAEAAGAEGAAFLAAWEQARLSGLEQIEDSAVLRAVEGVARPVYWNGEQVGERRHFDERLTMFLLRHGLPARYGERPDELAPARGTQPYQPIADDAEIVAALTERLTTFGAEILREQEMKLLQAPDD